MTSGSSVQATGVTGWWPQERPPLTQRPKLSPCQILSAGLSFTFHFFLNFIYISLFLAVLGFHCCCSGFSLGAESGGYFLAAVHGCLIVEAALAAEHGLQGVSASVAVAPGSVIAAPRLYRQAQYVWPMGWVALWHMSSSQIWDWTCVSCIGKQTLHHRAASVLPISNEELEPKKVMHLMSS